MTEPTKSITADDAKQSGNGVKGKEAEVGKERRPGSQARKVCKKLIDKTTAKALRNSLKCIDTSILVNEIEAGSNCNMHDLKSALLLLSKLGTIKAKTCLIVLGFAPPIPYLFRCWGHYNSLQGGCAFDNIDIDYIRWNRFCHFINTYKNYSACSFY